MALFVSTMVADGVERPLTGAEILVIVGLIVFVLAALFVIGLFYTDKSSRNGEGDSSG